MLPKVCANHRMRNIPTHNLLQQASADAPSTAFLTLQTPSSELIHDVLHARHAGHARRHSVKRLERITHRCLRRRWQVHV